MPRALTLPTELVHYLVELLVVSLRFLVNEGLLSIFSKKVHVSLMLLINESAPTSISVLGKLH